MALLVRLTIPLIILALSAWGIYRQWETSLFLVITGFVFAAAATGWCVWITVAYRRSLRRRWRSW